GRGGAARWLPVEVSPCRLKRVGTSMSPVTLTLRRREAPCDRPSAWLLPFTRAADLLGEICDWAVPHEGLRLFSVPRSVHDRSPLATLVVPPASLMEIEHAAALPLRLVGRVYLPLDAEISPPVTIDELNRLCLFPVMLFHPTAGLIGFEEKSAFRVSDL